jgi:hypothetical protein
MRAKWLITLVVPLALAGCRDDSVSPRSSAPAAPRGVYTVTGDEEVTVHWLANTESDIAGYAVYWSTCDDCRYDLIGTTTGTTFTVTGLTNGVTRFYAVLAYDRDGNESDLSYETLFDTPRPEGAGVVLNNYLQSEPSSGYDFSDFTDRNWDDLRTDIFFGSNGAVDQMFARDSLTDIQDYGYASGLDVIDYAPDAGWSPSGTVELIEGHVYVVWTRNDHYAKFRVTDIRPGGGAGTRQVVFDWAYQVDPGNRELRARPARTTSANARPIAWIR